MLPNPTPPACTRQARPAGLHPRIRMHDEGSGDVRGTPTRQGGHLLHTEMNPLTRAGLWSVACLPLHSQPDAADNR